MAGLIGGALEETYQRRMQQEPHGTAAKAQGLASVFALARTLQHTQLRDEAAKQEEELAEDAQREAPVDEQHFEVRRGRAV